MATITVRLAPVLCGWTAIRAMPNTVFEVLQPGSVLQIAKPIVCGITVQVTRFHPRRQWTDKCLHHQSMNLIRPILTIFD
jgi:hypothetical protein